MNTKANPRFFDTACYPRLDRNGETIGCNDSGGNVAASTITARLPVKQFRDSFAPGTGYL
jgi:hypothetical protein